MRRLVAICLVVCGLLFVSGAPSALAAPVGGPVVFRPSDGTLLFLHGRGSFRGALEVRRGNSGILVVNDLDLDDYVAGILEVPGRWPMEALKAQAVAARTYALYEKQGGHWQKFGFDVCATTSCQVYQGADAEQGQAGRRWAQAVRETRGEVLLYKGRPALTRYHSSSGGRTLSNEDFFTEGRVPYLRAVSDPGDDVSPLHRWNVTFTREQMQDILRVGIGLEGTLVDVRGRVDGKQVRIITQGGQLDVGTRRFTTVVNTKAKLMFPASFPGKRGDGRRLPFTMPSSRFSVEKTPGGFVVHGRGYGHGVGMSQYGAKGVADDGRTYKEILGRYYKGLHPTVWRGTRTMRVAVSQGQSQVAISGDGTFGVEAGVDTLAPATIGVWSVSKLGFRSLAVTPPTGYTLPLVLGGLRAPAEVFVDPPKRGGAINVQFVLPKAAQVTATISREGKVVARGRTVADAGEDSVKLNVDPEGMPRRATYTLKVEAFDGTARVTKSANVVLVRPARSAMPLLLAATIAALVPLVLVIRRRRRREDQSFAIPERGQLSPERQG